MLTTVLPKRYLPDEKVRPELLSLTRHIAENLAHDLLPQLGLREFRYGFARIGMGALLCRYVRGSARKVPLIVLSARNLDRAEHEYGAGYACSIETSLTWGLALALHDLHGLPPNPTQAEAFARAWYDSRSLTAEIASLVNQRQQGFDRAIR